MNILFAGTDGREGRVVYTGGKGRPRTGGGFAVQGPYKDQHTVIDGDPDTTYNLVSEPNAQLNGLFTKSTWRNLNPIWNPNHTYVTEVGLNTNGDQVKFNFFAPPVIHHPDKSTDPMEDGETTKLTNTIKARWNQSSHTLNIQTPVMHMSLEAGMYNSPKHAYLKNLQITKVAPNSNIRGMAGAPYRPSFVDDHGPDALTPGDRKRTIRRNGLHFEILPPQGGNLLEKANTDHSITLTEHGDREAYKQYETNGLFDVPINNPFSVFQKTI